MRRRFPGTAVQTELRRRSSGQRPSGPLLPGPPPQLRGAAAGLREPPPYFLRLLPPRLGEGPARPQPCASCRSEELKVRAGAGGGCSREREGRGGSPFPPEALWHGHCPRALPRDGEPVGKAPPLVIGLRRVPGSGLGPVRRPPPGPGAGSPLAAPAEAERGIRPKPCLRPGSLWGWQPTRRYCDGARWRSPHFLAPQAGDAEGGHGEEGVGRSAFLTGEIGSNGTDFRAPPHIRSRCRAPIPCCPH